MPNGIIKIEFVIEFFFIRTSTPKVSLMLSLVKISSGFPIALILPLLRSISISQYLAAKFISCIAQTTVIPL